MDAKTKITLVWELYQTGISNRQITRDLARNYETVGNYIAVYQKRDCCRFWMLIAPDHASRVSHGKCQCR